MVVHDLNVVRSIVPAKAYPPLIVYADRVLTLPVTSQSFQPIAGRHPEIGKVPGDVEGAEFSSRLLLDGLEPAHPLVSEKALSVPVCEAPDH